MEADVRSRDRHDEQGMALVAVILLLLMMSALCTALAVSGTTETLIARNQHMSAQARAAAEAGITHAVEATVANLLNWQVNGFATETAAVTGMLRGPDNLSGTIATDADNGSLEAFGIPRPPARAQLAGLPGVFYDARVFDEDDPARGVALSANDLARIIEDGVATTDLNTRLVVRATGYAGDNAVTAVEAMIAPQILPAILTQQPLTISGNPTVQGSQGSVHTNQNMLLSGNPDIALNATATGTYAVTGDPEIGGISGGNFPNISVPPVRAIDHRSKADYILNSDGTLTNQAGAVLCDASGNQNACDNAGYAWRYDGPSGWSLQGNSAPTGTFYVEGNATVSGNPGSTAAPSSLSIIAEGSIDISGNPTLMPDSPELLFVTDGDLKIGGNLEVPYAMEGLILVREQIAIHGNPKISGQIVVQGAASNSSLVTANTISGNPTLTYNGVAGIVGFTVSAWRTVQ